MNCAKTRSLLMAYLDSELDARTTVEIGEHLVVCESCRRRFDSEQRLERGLAGILRDETMPTEVWDSLRESLAPRVRPLRRWRPLALAAGLLMALGLTWIAWPRSGGVLEDLVASHGRLLTGRPPLSLVSADTGPVERDLASHSLGGWHLPAPGEIDGHDLELLGVRHDTIRGFPVATVVYRCCGELVSVAVMQRRHFDALPEGARAPFRPGEPTQFAIGGVQAMGLVTGTRFVSVVSAHETPLKGLVSA